MVEIERSDLTAGRLATEFKAGAQVIVVKGFPDIQRAWDLLIGNPDEQLPWRAPLVDIARNHYARGDLGSNVGDMFNFSQNRLAYIARKFELERGGAGTPIRCVPEAFVQGVGSHVTPDETRELCWEITDAIMRAMIPADRSDLPYRVVVHRLMYEHLQADINRLTVLTEDAVGRWAQLGVRIDRNREVARGPLATTGVSDIFAMLSLASPMRRALAPINRAFARGDRIRKVDGGAVIIGKPHCDDRFFSGLCGTRSTVSTEALVDGKWVELPIGLDRIVIVPGLLAKTHLGVEPVLHRVLHRDADSDATDPAGSNGNGGAAGAGSANITLLFGTK